MIDSFALCSDFVAKSACDHHKSLYQMLLVMSNRNLVLQWIHFEASHRALKVLSIHQEKKIKRLGFGYQNVNCSLVTSTYFISVNTHIKCTYMSICRGIDVQKKLAITLYIRFTI